MKSIVFWYIVFCIILLIIFYYFSKKNFEEQKKRTKLLQEHLEKNGIYGTVVDKAIAIKIPVNDESILHKKAKSKKYTKNKSVKK